jgi:hypothetical protein
MTLYRPTSPERLDQQPRGKESKASLFGTVLMLGIGALVIGLGVLMSVVAVVVGGTAVELP